MAQQRKRTAGDDLRDFKAGKISGNFYHNGIDRSDNYIQHTSAPRYITDENGKTQVASYNEWIQQEVFQHQHDLPNDTSSTSSNNKTATNDISVKSSNNTSSSTGSDIKSFFSGNLNNANSSAEDLKDAIKNPNKSLNDRVKGLTHMYNAAVATGDTKTAEKMQKEYDELADRVNKQTEINRQNAETAEAENAKLAEQAEKEQKYADKYKNSTLEQRKNARIHATTEELDWLNKHMYDNSSSKELEDYNNQLNKEANSLWNQRDEEQAYNRLKAIEDEQGKLKTAIDNAKLSEQKKKEYDDIVNNDIKAKTVLQKYYALQEYLKTDTSDADEADNTDNSYIKKLSESERNKIKADFLKLKDKGYNTESLYKWYAREQDEKKAEDNLDRIKMYAKKHPVIASANSIGQKFVGGVPDAIQYISANIDKKYNGGDGYINPDTTETAKSEAIRQSVSERINNDFGSLLYTAGMGIADSTINMVMNKFIPGGSAMGLTLLGTSAGVSGANEVIENGGSIENAVTTGVANGIAEALFEKISLEQLSAFRASGKSTFRAAVGNVLKGAFTEGSEEAFTDLANRLTDDAINKDLSSYNLSKKNYMEQGMSEAEAENAASWDFWKNVGLDFAGGAISGGVLNLATAGINLAGAKIDMAQNKESNAQIGKAVMADENFDLDLLIRQGLATDKNDRAYNYAHKMQKLVETDNEGKISAGDVGNLMYLINREVGKNPELVNKIAQVKKQNTREQSNQTVNAQNEQSPTQQNTAQNGQQNAEQASTVINATKKADTEDIGKMYGVYAFGKKHPNGIIATDTSTGKVVKVALKSLESSAKINRSDEENTLVFNTNDGKQVNADSITFSDSQFDTIVHSANEFDTYGARNYISNFEEWRESPQAQRMTDDEMLYKYNRAYSAAYSFGREGVKLDSLRETSEYKILKNILGEQIVSQALSTGRRDVDINTQHHANRLTELINRNGRADTSGVGVYADSGTEVSHIPQELINTLGNLSQKTGRNIIISDRLADGVNGVAKDGNIILSSEISSQKILATALHEAGHMIKKTNPTEWQTLSDFVSDYLVRKGVDLNKMIDRTIERYGNRLQADEHENTRDAALEEIVCDTLMSIASDEKALNIALSTKQNKSKIAAAIKSLIAKVKDWLIGKSTNYGAKAFAKDLEALEKLAQRFSEAADTARENITEQTEVQNGERLDVEKFSVEYTDDNKPVVVITDNILKGVPKKDWITTVKKTISNKFKNGIPIKGRLIKVNKDTGNEYTNSSYTQRIRSTNSTVYKNKLKAANNLDEIIISSTNYINEALNHPRKDNIKQFARGNVLMEIGNNQYRAEVIIGYTGGNNMLLYDLINLKSTSFTIKKADASTAQQKTNSEDSRLNASATNIISQNSNNVNEKFSLDEDTDEKAGAIHDTLNFSIDDEYDDWLVNDDGKSVFDAIKDEKNPDRRISILYHYAGKTAKHGMNVGKNIRIGQSGMHRLVCNVLQEYGVNLNGKNKSRIEAFKSVVNDFENSVKNDTQSFNDAIESLAEECKEYLKKSSLIDKKHSEWAKDLSDSLKEVTLVIPKGDIDFIKSAYGSITNFRKALMGKINIRTAKEYALIESVNEGSIEDVGNSISEIIGDIAGIDETFNWRSEEGYKTLERFINYDLAEHFVSIDGKSVQSIDEMAIEMAFDVATEYLKQQAKEVVSDNNANKELLHSITEIYNQANEEHELLLKEKNARYAEQISEQKKNAEKQIKSLVRKNNKKTEQYIKNDIKLRNKIKSDAKEYRITLRATKKTVAEEYRAERDKTKYRQKISTTLERLINRHLKPKPSNNVPISVVKPLYRLLSELTGNYSGFSKGVNDITEKTGYNKTVNQEGERVNKVTLSAETEKLISALNSEIANTDGKITLPPAMRNALLGYNVFDNKGNIKQHFTGLLEDVRNIFEKAEKKGKTSLKDFSLSELKRISTAFSEVKKLLDAANKIVINGKEYDAYLVSRKGAEELKKVTGTHKKGSNTQASTAKRTLLAYRKYMSDPIRFARMISGYHNDSVIVQMMEMLNQGQSDAEQLSIDWTNKYEEQMSRFSYKAKKDYVREQAMKFDGIDPNTKEELVDKKTGEQVKVGLTADMLVEMLLEYEDEYGRAHMMYSGYQVPNIKYIKRKNQQLMYSKDSGCYILPTESDISRIRDYVMNNEIAKTVYEICREMYNEDMQNAVNKVSNEKYGYEIAKVKNYCPITIDEDTVYGTFADVLINRSINSRAFLHERENFKYNRLKLKGATAKLTSQIKSVSSWCGLTMPIETFNRVFNMPRYDHKNDSLVKAVQEENLNSAENIRQKNNTHADEEEKSKLSIDEVLDFIEREEKQKKKKESTSTTEYFPSMKEIMKQQWGNESEEYISKLMGDLQGSTKQADPGRIDMLTGKYIRAVLTANISSAIKQLSSYPLAAARVGWKATLAGLKHIRPGKHTPFLNRALPDSYKQSIPYDEIAKYTPILEYRKQGNNSREMAEISRYKGLIDSSGWVGHTLDRLNWIEKNDVLMVEMNYWIAYEHVKGNMGISPDSKEFMPNVAKTLEDIINNMMPNSSVMQQGQILRSKNPVNRIFTICKSQVFCMVNAAMDASGEYNARLKDYKQAVSEFEKKQARTEVKIAKKQLARTYSAIIVSTAMTCGILMPLIAALFGKWDRYRDEDGNITPWSVGSRLLKDFGSELTGMFLFGDTVYNTVLALIDKNEEFYGLSLPGVDTINDFITGIINIARSDTPEKLRKNISSLVGTLGMLTGLPTKNLMNLFQGACNHIENFTKYGGTPTVNDYGEVSMQMYANYCYEALIDGDKKKFAKLYSEWLKGKTSTGKQVDKSYINSKLKTELEDDTEIIAAGNAFFNGDLTAYENTVEKYSDLGFDKTTVVKAINSIVSDLEDEQKNAEGLDKYDNEEESDSKPELYKYSDAFDFLKNGDTESYEKVEKYLMEHKGKTKNQMKKLMQSASRTDPIFKKYIEASKSNDADTTHTLYRQLLNIYGSESKFKSALRKCQDKIKKQKSK